MNFDSIPDADLPSESLLERVLSSLGFKDFPLPTLQNLRQIYAAWCQAVPFDNVRKLIHVRRGAAGPLPGSIPAEFLEAWLKFGTGGTCWAGAGAFHALLTALGFDSLRGVGTMLVTNDLPPNHGTVAVRFDEDLYLVDCSILHGEPLALRASSSSVSHPAWGVECASRAGRWHVRWRPLNRLDGFECRLERFGATAGEYRQFHDQTRGWSPFNFQVNARRNRGQGVLGLAFGNAVFIKSDGTVEQRPVSDPERRRVLIEEVGIAEEIVSLLPADIPTPPPPGSRTSQNQPVFG